jgi:hypothetical protein
MIGGKSVYTEVFNSLFPTVAEKKDGIAMFMLRKVGPIVTLKLDEACMSDILAKLS